jgi:hypothetical protein
MTTEQVLLEGRGWRERVGAGAEGRNEPNNVCTCEQINNNNNNNNKRPMTSHSL